MKKVALMLAAAGFAALMSGCGKCDATSYAEPDDGTVESQLDPAQTAKVKAQAMRECAALSEDAPDMRVAGIEFKGASLEGDYITREYEISKVQYANLDSRRAKAREDMLEELSGAVTNYRTAPAMRSYAEAGLGFRDVYRERNVHNRQYRDSVVITVSPLEFRGLVNASDFQ